MTALTKSGCAKQQARRKFAITLMAFGLLGLIWTIFFVPQPAQATGGNSNSPGYWESQYSAHNAVCYKYEGASSNDHGSVVQDDSGKSTGVQLNAYQAGWPGDHWEALIVNGGPDGDAVYEHPSAGTTYSTPGENVQGEKYDVSHWIVCKGTTPTPPPPPPAEVTPSLTFVSGTCLAAGSVNAVETDDYSWTTSGPASARVYTAHAKGEVTLTQTVFGPYDVRQTDWKAEECQPGFDVVQQCGYVKVTYDNNSKWTRWPDFTYEGDGVTPNTDYGFPYYTTMQVGAGETVVLFEKTFDEDYNGGTVDVTYQDKLGDESDISTGPFTITVTTDCVQPEPPAVTQCVSYGSVHTTNLTTWNLSETRATGHNDLVEGGLNIWTEGATSTDKAAGYYSTNFPLSDLGTETIAEMLGYTSNFGIAPGLQMVVDFDANGTPDGILVGEAVYGNGWWLSNSAAQFVKDGSPNTGGGYGSSWYGTPNEWLQAFPDARVKAIGYSLGSGVHANGVINQITIGCTEYTFGIPEPVETTPVKPTWVDPCGLDNGYWEYTDTDQHYYEVTENNNGSQTIRTYAKGDYVFPEGAKTQWTKKDTGDLCPVEVSVTVTDQMCFATENYSQHYEGGSIVLPTTEGVSYVTHNWNGTARDGKPSDLSDLAPGQYLITATPGEDYELVLGDGWVASPSGKATYLVTIEAAEDCADTPPVKDPKVETGTWSEWKKDCDSKTATRTRTDTTTTYVWDEDALNYVVDEVTTDTKTDTRDLTDEELASCVTPKIPGGGTGLIGDSSQPSGGNAIGWLIGGILTLIASAGVGAAAFNSRRSGMRHAA